MKMDDLISEIEDDLYYLDVATYDIYIADTYSDYVMLASLKKKVADTSNIWEWFSSLEEVCKRVYEDLFTRSILYNLYCVLTFYPYEKHKRTQELVENCSGTFYNLIECMMCQFKIEHLQVIEEVEGIKEYNLVIDLLSEHHRNQLQVSR